MTIKQKKAIKEIVENGRSASKAMKLAGYSHKTAVDPGKLTRSKAFKEVMEEMGITDEQLVKTLKEGLEANKTIVMGTKSEESFVDIQPDHPTRHKFLETSLKLKGHSRETPPPNTVIIPIYGGLSARPNDVPLPGHDSDPQDIQT